MASNLDIIPVPETKHQPQTQEAGSGTGSSSATKSSAQGSGIQDYQFKKKICIKFLPSRKDVKDFEDVHHLNPDYKQENIRCKCGLPYKEHDHDAIRNNNGDYPIVEDLLLNKITIQEFIISVYEGDEGEKLSRGYKWNTHAADKMVEADGAEMGEIEFQMDHSRTLHSKFTRLSDETDMDDLRRFLKKDWKLLEAEPELIISLIGTTAKKALADKLAEGILKLSRRVNLIILTSGLESDIVAKKIGDAVTREQRWTTEGDKQQSKAKIRCVGITSWGSLKRKPEKENNGKFTIEADLNSPFQSLVFNPGHKYLLLVDNGTTEELPNDLNTFWAELEKCLKTDSLHVMNFILGNENYEKKNLAMTEKLLQFSFPVIFLQRSENYLDRLIDSVLQFPQMGKTDKNTQSHIDNFEKSVVSKLTNTDKDKQIKTFLTEQLIGDAKGQKKNVITVCDLSCDDSNNPEVGHSLDSTILRTFTKPSIVKARVNNQEPNHDSVLQVLKLAIKLRCWDVSMDQLLTYKYIWTDDAAQKQSYINVKDITDDSLTLTWKPPKEKGGSKVKKYHIMMKEDDGEWKEIATVKSCDNGYKVSNLQPDKKYDFELVPEKKTGRDDAMKTMTPIILKEKPKESEKTRLKDIFKDCLLRDRPTYITVFDRDGWVPMDTFLSLEMLAELYNIPHLVNDPLQDVYRRNKISNENSLKMLVCSLILPDCYLPKFFLQKQEVKGKGDKENGVVMCKHPYKHLLIWAVVSKRWNVVNHILLSRVKDILVWFLATAYLCKAVALRQLEEEIKNEYKDKQHYYEDQGKRMLENLCNKHGNMICKYPNDKTETTYPHLSLETTAGEWGELCPADLALLGNFKTFVSSEAFHSYTVRRWKKNVKEPGCCYSVQTRVKFYIHWVCYMIMVSAFCAAVISRVRENHYAHQIWLVLWICCYLLGEVITRRQQQKVSFSSKRQQISMLAKKYLHLLMLFLFLIGGFVCTFLGYNHWGGMLYGLACLILILCICGHFLSTFRLFAPQISILKKALKEVLTFMILIILLVWSVTMIFHAVLCIDTNLAEHQTSADKGWTNTLHAAFFLYLSLYGDYSFELNESGHLSCVEDKRSLMWVSYVIIGLHILVGNVLVMNLLVSVISTKTEEQRKSDLVYVWKSNWYKLTLHYEKQTILPPPFNIGELIVRWVYCCIRNPDAGGNRDAASAHDQPDSGSQPPKSQLPESSTIPNLQLYQQEASRPLLDSRLLLDETRQEDTRI